MAAFTIELQVGVPTLVTQTTSYALPPVILHLTSSQSVDVSADGSSWSALTNSSTIGAFTSGAFVRCTTSTTCTIIAKKY
jgi:hypothetical protein